MAGHRCWTPLRLVSGQQPPRPSRARACWTLTSSLSVFLRAKPSNSLCGCRSDYSGNGQNPNTHLVFFPIACLPHKRSKHQASSVSIQHDATGSLVDVMAMGNGHLQPSRQWRCEMSTPPPVYTQGTYLGSVPTPKAALLLLADKSLAAERQHPRLQWLAMAVPVPHQRCIERPGLMSCSP